MTRKKNNSHQTSTTESEFPVGHGSFTYWLRTCNTDLLQLFQDCTTCTAGLRMSCHEPVKHVTHARAQICFVYIQDNFNSLHIHSYHRVWLDGHITTSTKMSESLPESLTHLQFTYIFIKPQKQVFVVLRAQFLISWCNASSCSTLKLDCMEQLHAPLLCMNRYTAGIH